MYKKIILLLFFALYIFESAAQRFKMDSVSVNLTTNQTIVSWYPIADVSDLDSVRIGIPNPDAINAYISIGVVGIEQTSFIDSVDNADRNPSLSSITYTVSGKANEGESPDPWQSLVHKTIFLETDLDTCLAQVNLTWNSYLNWSNGVDKYRIYKILGNDTTLEGQVDKFKTSFTVKKLLADTTYAFFIRAHGVSGSSSTSNKVELYTEIPSPPDTLTGNYASYNEDNFIDLNFEIDQDADIKYYFLQRSLNPYTEFVNLDTLDNSYIEDSILSYTDEISARQTKYYYKIIAVNTCDVIIDTSNIVSNIVLTGVANDNQTDSLIWQASVPDVEETYNIYRSILQETAVPVEMNYSDTMYVDDVSPYTLNLSDGEFCYYIVGTKANNTELHYNSNTICEIQLPVIWVPNAFTPNGDGKNDDFGPIISYASSNNYSLIIYDRWGEKMFETNDFETKWDGTSAGRKVKPGVYVYYLTFTDAYQRLRQQTGAITVIYP